jgi:uncharacterized membrane protein YphA (DoxX/SURF4 family)
VDLPQTEGAECAARDFARVAEKVFTFTRGLSMNALTMGVARVLFALPFGLFGIFHLVRVPRFVKMVPIPGAEFWVYFTGAALIAGSLGMILKIQAKWAALGLALLMLFFVLFVHGPGLFDPVQRDAQLAQVLKNLSLMAGALTWAGIFARGEAK